MTCDLARAFPYLNLFSIKNKIEEAETCSCLRTDLERYHFTNELVKFSPAFCSSRQIHNSRFYNHTSAPIKVVIEGARYFIGLT